MNYIDFRMHGTKIQLILFNFIDHIVSHSWKLAVIYCRDAWSLNSTSPPAPKNIMQRFPYMIVTLPCTLNIQ